MAKNVTEQEFVHGGRSMTFGRKVLRDGSIEETKWRLRNKNVSQESLYFMKQARMILWRELRGIPIKTCK